MEKGSKGNSSRYYHYSFDGRVVMPQTTMNFKLVAQEIDLIMSTLYGRYISEGRPTKRGGLRFLDIVSNKTFGFEKTRETDKGNLLILSAPYKGALEDIERKGKLEALIKKGPNEKYIHDIVIRQSRDKGKEDKLFIEVKYHLPTGDLLESEKIAKHGEKYRMNNSKVIIRAILREFMEPFAQQSMDHLINVVRSFQ
jgi:hypothetical protein